ncbi:MAG: SCO family protein [Bradyrhizobiaceae bacterium]|nr:SCO family protein [Bradyrhizobiaceae bacterium]
MRYVTLFIVLGMLMASCKPEEHTGIPVRPAPSFKGVDQNGQQFTSEALKGTPWLASFFFTTCQSVCPVLNAEQRTLVNEFGNKLKFVSISTDPSVDTGATLAAYAKEYGAVPGTWWMLNIPETEMRELSTKGFLLMDPKEPEMHSTRLVAVDAEGMIQGYFDSSDSLEMQRLRTWISSQL